MRRWLLKILIIVMLGVVTHDYFIKQCDIVHVKKCDILQDHTKHQLFHIQAVVDEELPFYSDFSVEVPRRFTLVLKTQYFNELSPPPPKRS